MYVLGELIAAARAHLDENGYSLSSKTHYERIWAGVAQWGELNAPDGWDRDAERRYLADAGLLGDRGELTRWQVFVAGGVRRLLDLAETGRPRRPGARLKYVVPEGLLPAYELYKSELESRGLRDATVRGRLSDVRRFLSTCGAETPSELGPGSAKAFAATLSGCAAQTRAELLYAARDLGRTLAGAGMCDESLAGCLSRIPGHKDSSLPSAYSVDEVSALLAAETSGRCPKRTRAMMLLASVLGMRVGDIKALTLGDIDWRAKRLSFAQSKTGVAQVLPMPDEVWLSLADYIKNERPKVEGCDRVFLTAYAPHRPIDSDHVFHRAITRAFADAGVDPGERHHGLHSLRHSDATNMLSDGTPYPTISAVLGHSSTNVTRRYLSIDVESLRGIALEVPTCR